MTEQLEFCIETQGYNELVPLGERIRELVAASSVTSGVVYIITKHTTTGITVNERLECLEDDIMNELSRFFPEDGSYFHNRFLMSYGAMAGNPTGHLKAMVTGNHAVFPVVDGQICLGSAQEIYLAEFDGPQPRTIHVTIMGD